MGGIRMVDGGVLVGFEGWRVVFWWDLKGGWWDLKGGWWWFGGI